MSKKNDKKIGIVYSTNPDFEYESELSEAVETLSADKQLLRVHIDRKHRGGKTVTLIRGFVGSDEDMKALEKLLKNKCGVGGSSKDGEIIIQGERKEQLIALLKEMGYTKTKGVG
jgi:translation initiation factor 1